MTEEKAQLDASNDRWTVSGSLTMDSASELLRTSAACALPDAGIVDLAGVDRVDSAGVAVLLAWKRRAAADARPLVFAGVPASMTSLAQLYGVEELLVR
jgi:phospholipid transport system transporter-binding protein